MTRTIPARGAAAAASMSAALLAAVTLLLALAPRAEAYLYWSNATGSIARAQNNGTGVDSSFVGGLQGGIWGVTVDSRHLWWANLATRRIGRAARDGSGADANFIDTGGQAQDVATDGEHVWWTSAGAIGRARLDGSGVTHGFIAGGGATMLTLDDEYVYWTRSSANAIGRARLDGSGVNPSFVVGADAPLGIAVDGEHLYWVNGGPSNSIGRARLDGSGVDQSFVTGLSAGAGLTIDATHLYWANQAINRVGRANLDGSGVNQSFSGPGIGINDVAVDGLPATPTLTGVVLQGHLYAGDAPFRFAARLAGGSNPTGTLSFHLYGPGDATCSGTPVVEESVTVAGNGDYLAPEFVPQRAGEYRWRVVYSGDEANRPSNGGACGLGGLYTALKRGWSLRTSAPSPTAVVGGALSAQSAIAAPVCFAGRRAKPSAQGWGCFAGPRGRVADRAAEVGGAGAAAGGGARAADGVGAGGAGAADRGDAGGARGVAPRAAGDPARSIVFRLYGPEDGSCTLPPVFTDAVGVTAALGGTARSAAFVPREAGSYRWTAEYTGDDANAAVAPDCAGAAVVEVAKATPTLAVSPLPATATAGDALDATATLAGGFEPGGELTFRLHGPGDERCEAAPVHVATAVVGATGADGAGALGAGVGGAGGAGAPGAGATARATAYVATAAGTYRWVVSYAGDGANEPVATGCGDPAAAVVVAERPVDPGPPPPPPPPPVDPGPPAKPAPALSGFTLAGRCTRPAAGGVVTVGLRLRMARPGTVAVRVERALGTRGLARCPQANPNARFGGRFRTVMTKRSVKTAAAPAAAATKRSVTTTAAPAAAATKRSVTTTAAPAAAATKRSAKPQTGGTAARVSAAALARTVTLRLRLAPALYRITVRTRTADGRLSAPRTRFLRVLSPRG
jgi:hypothetical protein